MTESDTSSAFSSRRSINVWMRFFRTRVHRVLADRRRVAVSVVTTAVLLVVALNAFVFSCGFNGCPSAAEIRSYRPTEGGRVFDRRGVLLGQIESVRRENVALEHVPQHVRDAFLVTEDRRFYDHSGLDWRAVGRAVGRNITALGFREGFSTVTMQLARTSFIPGGRSGNPLARKLIELRLARLLEKALSKDEILELYLNAIYLGGGVYGVEGASRDLFGKSVRNVTVAEGALLAALPKAPSVYNPRNDAARARTRRDLVLKLMFGAGLIDSVQLGRALRSEIRVAKTQWANGKTEPSALTPVRSLVDSVLRSLDRYGEEVVVHTTLDAAAQKAADQAVTARTIVIQRESDAHHGGSKGQVQGAMVAIDPMTGGILALVGAGKYERGGFNRAFYARRQPGSVFKPFVYAAAIEKGLTPATLVDDAPISVREHGKVWTPANYGDEYFGTLTARNALAKSANGAAVRVSRLAGEENIVRVAKQNGINSELLPVPSIALGALEVTPVELVRAYAPFANGGFRVTPQLVSRIETRSGEVIWEGAGEWTRVMDERDAFLVTSMLTSVIDEGTGSAIRSYGVHGVVAGKTGTTNDATDVWFVGYTPTIVAGFWFGYDTPRMISRGANGGRHAAPAWAEFYRNGWRDRDVWRGWEAPEGIVRRAVDEETGQLAGDWCPHVRDEWFKTENQPTEFCTSHLGPRDSFWGKLGRSIGNLFRLGDRSAAQKSAKARSGQQGSSTGKTGQTTGRRGGGGGGKGGGGGGDGGLE